MAPELHTGNLHPPSCWPRTEGDAGVHTRGQDLIVRLTFCEGGSDHHGSKSLFKSVAGVFSESRGKSFPSRVSSKLSIFPKWSAFYASVSRPHLQSFPEQAQTNLFQVGCGFCKAALKSDLFVVHFPASAPFCQVS